MHHVMFSAIPSLEGQWRNEHQRTAMWRENVVGVRWRFIQPETRLPSLLHTRIHIILSPERTWLAVGLVPRSPTHHALEPSTLRRSQAARNGVSSTAHRRASLSMQSIFLSPLQQLSSSSFSPL